ncbi:MAG: hypothetical protein NC833_02355 [Candidatus Omnitrophica bacterium]|nr:hypothetical protein [Candidatus Omnitrophota bacterium]
MGEIIKLIQEEVLRSPISEFLNLKNSLKNLKDGPTPNQLEGLFRDTLKAKNIDEIINSIKKRVEKKTLKKRWEKEIKNFEGKDKKISDFLIDILIQIKNRKFRPLTDSINYKRNFLEYRLKKEGIFIGNLNNEDILTDEFLLKFAKEFIRYFVETFIICLSEKGV